MATQSMEREMVIQTIEQYLDDEGWPIAAQTVAQPKEGKAGLFSRVADALWRATCGLSFSGLFLPLEPAFRHSNAISPKEKQLIDAYLMGLNRPA